MSADQSDEKDARRALRPRIQQQIQASSKCRGPGRWLARKSQLVVLEHGGCCRGDRNRDEAKSPHAWTKENWQTKAGAADARHGKIMNCDLPQEAPILLTDEQKQAVETKQTPHGGQNVANTAAAKAARAYVTRHDPRSLNEEQLKRLTKIELVQIARRVDLPYRSKMNKAQLARTLRRHFRQPS